MADKLCQHPNDDGKVTFVHNTYYAFIMLNVLPMQRKQLQENMIFFLAGLSKKSYDVLREIFRLYEENTLGKAPKMKKDRLAKRDCKGSNFKGKNDMKCASTTSLCGLVPGILTCTLDITTYYFQLITHTTVLMQEVSVVGCIVFKTQGCC